MKLSKSTPVSRYLYFFIHEITLVCLAASVQAVPLPTTKSENAPSQTTPVRIEQQVDCLQPQQTEDVLEQTLKETGESADLHVTVVTTPGIEKYVVTMRVIQVRSGEILLERQFSASAQECNAAHLLLQTMLAQFLSNFPAEHWSRSDNRNASNQSVSPVKVKPVTSAWQLQPHVESRWPTPGLAVGLRTTIEMGGENTRLFGGGGARLGIPRRLNDSDVDGRIIDVTPVLIFGVRFAASRRLATYIGAHVGALYVSGIDFPINHSGWAPWAELSVLMLWRLGSILVGPGVGVSPLVHKITTDTGETATVPWLHFGITISIPLLEN
ncbi:MAG: hypothetical protein JXX29_22740 [Deltaproteobacteria bacterium]|nr:hypothetical protein [Deltaproteobacteria bacterium]MBN2674516.1 hypothetical protein [Deltaproteobacteria bacterium]